MPFHGIRSSVPCAKTFAKINVHLLPIPVTFLHYGSFCEQHFKSPDRLCARQQHRPESGFAGGRIAKGGLQEDFLRQDDGLPHESTWLGSAHRVCSSRRHTGRDGIEPHDPFSDASAGDGATAGEEAGQPGLIARKYRHKHRHRALLPVDDGRDPSDGTRTPRRARFLRSGVGKGARKDRRAAANRCCETERRKSAL